MTPDLQAQVAAILARLPPDDAAVLAIALSLDLPRPHRLDARDEAIRAAVKPGVRPRPAASALASELTRYATTGWHRSEEPKDLRRQQLHQILQLNSGKVLGWRQIVNIINKV